MVPPALAERVKHVAWHVGLALPGLLIVFFGFREGGYFVGSHALVAGALLVFLVLRITLARDPFLGITAWVAAVAVPLALFTVWVLISGSWGPPHRALLEYDRALMYLLGFIALATLPGSRERTAWTIRGMAAGIVIVCGAGLITRVLPEVWTIDNELAEDRLSFPITYWNALGVLGAIGVVFALHLTTSLREPRWVRVAAAAVIPILVATVYLTFSRGGIAAGLIGIVVLFLVGRPGGFATGLAAVLPACALVLVVAAGADAIASDDPSGPAAVEEGKGIALAIAAAIAFAVAVRWAGLAVDRRLAERFERRGPWELRKLAGAYAGGAVVTLLVALAVGAPGMVERQYDRFVEGDQTSDEDLRERLFDPGNNGRIEEWRVAINAFESEPLRGTGAGTYQLHWARERPIYLDVTDGHSLYVEVLGELGIVGLGLLLAALGALMAGLASRIRGPDRGLAAVAFAATVTWALHAGLDWDWEMPVVTFWVFALGAVILAAPADRPRVRTPGRSLRVPLALGCLVLLITPVTLYRSQTALDTAVDALRDNRCDDAIDAALRSLSSVRSRPEPFEVIGFCDVRLRQFDLAERAMRAAVRRDPDSWEFHYGLALVRAAAGRDPRPAAKRAFQLNPKGALALAAEEQLIGDDPRVWSVRARGLPLPGY